MRWFWGLLAALLLMPCALAEDDCTCHQDACICFVQYGDEGMAVEAIQNALIAAGYLPAREDAACFDHATQQAVMAFQTAHDLSPTGMMDDTTLTLLLWGMTPQELDAAQPESNGRFVWIPTDGGRRRHVKESCSQMQDPRRVSVRNAQQLGMEPCGRCNKDGKKE